MNWEQLTLDDLEQYFSADTKLAHNSRPYAITDYNALIAKNERSQVNDVLIQSLLCEPIIINQYLGSETFKEAYKNNRLHVTDYDFSEHVARTILFPFGAEHIDNPVVHGVPLDNLRLLKSLDPRVHDAIGEQFVNAQSVDHTLITTAFFGELYMLSRLDNGFTPSKNEASVMYWKYDMLGLDAKKIAMDWYTLIN